MSSRERKRSTSSKAQSVAARKRVLRLPHGSGREALIEAAVRAVARDGPRAFSYRAVAREAGVTHGLVHYHFGSRDALMVEAYKWAVSKVIEKMHVYPIENWIDEYTTQLADMSPEDGELHIFLNTLVLDACRNVDKLHLVEPVFTEVFGAVERALKASRVPTTPALARLVMASLIGMTMQHQALRKPKHTRESMAELGRLLASLRHAGR